MAEKLKVLIDVLKAGENYLRDKGIESPRLNAELLLADSLKTERLNLYLDFDKILNNDELDEYREKIKRRGRNEPLQYITGQTEFYGLSIKLNKSVLIPRQETEILAEKAIEFINNKNLQNILEIGTGSGCVSIAIAKETSCRIDAIDINPEGLNTAKENAFLNQVQDKINFYLSDIMKDDFSFNGFDVIVSNPPYIPLKDVSTLQKEVKDHEPMQALTDNKDGLEFYKRIFDLLEKTGNEIYCFLEIGDNRKNDIEGLIVRYGLKNYRFEKDLMGMDRVLIIENKITVS